MSAHDAGRSELRRREALLQDLRGVHRRERAPGALRQRVLDRFAAEPSREAWLARAFGRWLPAAPDRRVALMSAALALVSCAVLGLVAARWFSDAGVSPLLVESDAEKGEQPALALGPEPKGEARSAPGGGPASNDARPAPRGSLIAPERACPLFEVPSGAMIAASKTSLDGPASGLALHTFDLDTLSCGPLTRRYLELLPPGLAPKSSAPVLLVLHDAGKSAESMRLDSRWHFDEEARRQGFILVYANAAPGPATDVEIGNSGSWQSDPRAHPEVDDEQYLQRVLADLIVRHVIDGNNDVYLAGFGDGAMMALTAAVRQPQAYVGVAAIMPSRPEAIEPPNGARPARLSRTLFMLDEKSTLDATNRDLARRWARAFGIDRPARQRFFFRVAPHGAKATRVRQLDAALPASGSAAVRLLVVDGAYDPFPALAESPDGASDVWAFLRGADGVQPLEEETEDPAPPIPDGVSIRPEDVGFEDPPMVFDDELVAPPAKPRR